MGNDNGSTIGERMGQLFTTGNYNYLSPAEENFRQSYQQSQATGNMANNMGKYGLYGLAGGAGLGALAYIIKHLMKTDEKTRLKATPIDSTGPIISIDQGDTDDTGIIGGEHKEARLNIKEAFNHIVLKGKKRKIDQLNKKPTKPSNETNPGTEDLEPKKPEVTKTEENMIPDDAKSKIACYVENQFGGQRGAYLKAINAIKDIQKQAMTKAAEMPSWFSAGVAGGTGVMSGLLGFHLVRMLAHNLDQKALDEKKRKAEEEFTSALNDALSNSQNKELQNSELSMKKLSSVPGLSEDYTYFMDFLDRKANEMYEKQNVKKADVGLQDHLLYGLLAGMIGTGGLGAWYGWNAADKTDKQKKLIKAIETNKMRRSITAPPAPVMIMNPKPEVTPDDDDTLVLNAMSEKAI